MKRCGWGCWLLVLIMVAVSSLGTGTAWANPVPEYNPQVLIQAPENGEILVAGQKCEIKWSYPFSARAIRLYFSVDGGNTWTRINWTDILPPASSLVWTVPDQETVQARVKLEVSTLKNDGSWPPHYAEHWYYTQTGDFTITRQLPASPLPTKPAAPSDLKAAALSPSQVDLTWQDNATNEAGFKLERKGQGDYSFKVIADLGADVKQYRDSNLQASTAYYYRLKAYNAFGDSACTSEVAATTNAIIISEVPLPPNAPAELSAVTASSSQINLYWRDNANNELGFILERMEETSRTYTEVCTLGPDVISFVDHGLKPGTGYFYRLKAFNKFGQSAYSNLAQATTNSVVQRPVLGAPTGPEKLAATALSADQVKLTWQDKADNESGYKVERQEGQTFMEIATVPADSTVYVDQGLQPDCTYVYRIRAFNPPGYSPYSNSVTIQTKPLEYTPLPSPGLRLVRFFIGSSDYYIDDRIETMDAVPVVAESRALLPVRYVAMALDAQVNWDPNENKVTISSPGRVVEMWIGDNQALVNGQEVAIDPNNSAVVPLLMEPGRTMLPLRFIAENLGCQVAWDPEKQEIRISQGAN